MTSNLTYDTLTAYIDGLHTTDSTLTPTDYTKIIDYILANGETTNTPRDLIQLRRGNESDLPLLAQGEPAFTLDTGKFFVGGENGNVEIGVTFTNVKANGAKGDGSTDDTANIQSTLNNGGVIIFPPGTYEISSPLTIQSGTRIIGSGATLQVTTGFPNNRGIFENSDTVNGNTDISVEDISFDFSLNSQAGMKAVWYQKCQRVKVIACKTEQGGDVIAFTGCTDYAAMGNVCLSSIGQTVIDNWGGCKNGVISNNRIDGNTGGPGCGILVSGFNTGLSANTTEGISVVGNVIRNVSLGIYLQGGTDGTTPGLVKDCVVTGNTIDTTTKSHGIYLTETQNCVISDNVIKDIYQVGIMVTKMTNGAVSTDCVISSNVLDNINTSSTVGNSAIHFESGSDNNVVIGNHLKNVSTCNACILLYQANNNVVSDNYFDTAKYTAISRNGDTGNLIKNNMGYNPIGHQTPPTVPAASTAIQNPFGVDCMVVVTGGSGVNVGIGSTSNTTPTGITDGVVMVPANGYVDLGTYTTAPTWTWYGF